VKPEAIAVAVDAPDRRSVAGRLFIGLVTGYGYTAMALWTALGICLFPMGFALWKAVTRWSNDRIMRHFVWIYGRGWLLIMSPFVRFRTQGLEGLGAAEPAVLVVNHRSYFDTYCMGLLPVFDVTFAVRAWPFRIPWYRWFMLLAGYINVEASEWDEIRAQGRRLLASRSHLLFFPEGHRSRDGRLGRFYSGAFRLASELGVKVIPLCISGTEELLPPGRLSLRPARVTLRALPAVDPEAFQGPDGHRRLCREVKGQIAAALVNTQGSTGTPWLRH